MGRLDGSASSLLAFATWGASLVCSISFLVQYVTKGFAPVYLALTLMSAGWATVAALIFGVIHRDLFFVVLCMAAGTSLFLLWAIGQQAMREQGKR